VYDRSVALRHPFKELLLRLVSCLGRSLQANVDLDQGIIKLKPTKKRSNRTIYIDEEATRVLQKWIQARKTRKGANGHALFSSIRGSAGDLNVVKLPKFAKEAQILKNSVASNGTAIERIFPD
jgi:site-specific recombinase XerC